MVNGKVVRFDDDRGYGFLAPDDGGEDVFVHANDIQDSKQQFRPGARVEFAIEAGDRGLKASQVRLLEPAADAEPRAPRREQEDDGLCDVLSVPEFRTELTEALLEAAPTLTAAQIVQVRRKVTDIARRHNWIEA
ncbi:MULTISPECIES: cold-shock protein [unclassified Saccharopolyspora]|uniref:cold-shock protein n=1 Tax=unclassified Saccharopolyspora TaxID=2646250 RepID=UPI001CD61E5E|nr:MULTISPECIES: cold shock domain-containing protein [unclassified Saccharopolyspora]MCA1185341.1 cold shock domain-containing protein [Saccharopolyspora sp. 6T]MCA1194248.1 cold shock domain-containing protein [Saccharopolyspora sp. 6V]MCA1224680.1 cold shock domain-containing protein [Saccharopolyspora sp. 6M]MCA1279392.1 cold shock domain-containing protein [Saccharopolyspora sp. 7B]